MTDIKKADPFIFDIQRSSFVDGPGIRTTVFFSGCRLRCRWCHNPESWTGKKVLMLFMNHCTGCAKCVQACTSGAVSIIDNKLCIDRSICSVCGECVRVCANGARRICGAYMDIEQVMNEITKDKAFYDASGGGVTFSGGECLNQGEALIALLELCAARNIHTALDTSGDASRHLVEKLVPLTGLFLYDIKCIDEKKHISFTGYSNREILDNLQFLLNTVPEKVWIRIPVIPGFNAEESELRNIRDWLSRFPAAAQIDLLPYHRLGENKFEALGIENKFLPPVPSDEQMKEFRNLFSNS